MSIDFWLCLIIRLLSPIDRLLFIKPIDTEDSCRKKRGVFVQFKGDVDRLLALFNNPFTFTNCIFLVLLLLCGFALSSLVCKFWYKLSMNSPYESIEAV